MKNNMKRIVTLMMIMTMLLMGVVLADNDQMIIYAQVPSDWIEPSVWAWGEDGTAVFEAWPGEKMIEDANNEGWFYIYVPNWATSVIINGNEGTVQTSDLTTNGLNSWITVTTPEDAVLTNDALTTGDLPEAVEVMTINAMVPEDWTMPSLWAWSAPDGTNAFPNWPGQELEGSADGWYAYDVPTWVNSVIVNANLGAIQTSDISIEAKDVWLVVEDADTVTVHYEKPVVETPAEEMIKIHAIAPEDWVMPNLWAWSAPDGTNVFPNWPGQELVEEDGWYTYSVPNWVNSIIINGNLGAVQTTDVSIEAKDVWVVVSGPETIEVYYEEPNLEATAEESESVEVAEEVAEELPEENSTSIIIIVSALIIVLVFAGGMYYKTKKK